MKNKMILLLIVILNLLSSSVSGANNLSLKNYNVVEGVIHHSNKNIKDMKDLRDEFRTSPGMKGGFEILEYRLIR